MQFTVDSKYCSTDGKIVGDHGGGAVVLGGERPRRGRRGGRHGGHRGGNIARASLRHSWWSGGGGSSGGRGTGDGGGSGGGRGAGDGGGGKGAGGGDGALWATVLFGMSSLTTGEFNS